MTKSENLSFVFLKMSFTTRERLIPAMACSTRTRTLDILRLRSFSLAVSSFLRGFFSVEAACGPWAHILESRYPYASECV